MSVKSITLNATSSILGGVHYVGTAMAKKAIRLEAEILLKHSGELPKDTIANRLSKTKAKFAKIKAEVTARNKVKRAKEQARKNKIKAKADAKARKINSKNVTATFNGLPLTNLNF